MDADRVLAFRLDRLGLTARRRGAPADAATVPVSDVSRDAALIALGARLEGLDGEAYRRAVDAGELVVAYGIRGAIHAVAPRDVALFGRVLVARDDRELAAQLGPRLTRQAADGGFAPTEALAEVAAAVAAALADRGPLDKDALHEELRRRVRAELLPPCAGCGTHHVSPMLWRYATVVVGARLDAGRRYRLGDPGPAPDAAAAVRRFLAAYGPADARAFAGWAGLARTHAARLWEEVAPELVEAVVDGAPAWVLREDRAALESPPAPSGIRLLPPGDPALQAPNRALLVPDDGLRRRLFRPVASPGVVLRDGRVAGAWRTTVRGRRTEVSVEALHRLPRRPLEAEAQRVAALRGAPDLALVLT